MKHTLSNKGVDIWNGPESNLKNIKSCNIFKNMIKTIYKSFKSHIINQLYNVIYCTVDSFVYCGLVGIWQVILHCQTLANLKPSTFSTLSIYIYIYIYIVCVHLLIQPHTQDLVFTDMRPWV